MKSFKVLLLAWFIATLFQGCGNRKQTTDTVPQKELKLAFVANNPNDFWAIVHLGCNAAARQLGNVEVEFCAPITNTVAAQEEILRACLKNDE